MRYVTTTGRTINLDKVNFALLFDKISQSRRRAITRS